jgi:K+/H+ antiporter YhaU regulatory subunit KhtT
MSNRFTLKQRLRYRFDNGLARGIGAVLTWLGAITAILVLVVSVLTWLFKLGPSDEPTSFLESIWLAAGRYLDAGTFTGDQASGYRVFSVLITLVGIFIGAAIIGLISSGLDTRLQELRRGKSDVIEGDHTLIIGRNAKLPSIISELVEANRSNQGHVIVILSPDDVVEVAEALNRDVTDLGNSRLVVRSGLPTRLADLLRMNPRDAKSIIVLNPEGEESNTYGVKVILALHKILGEASTVQIIAEIEGEDTSQALREVVGSRLIAISPTEIIARITAQTSRASGLGLIYQELLDFEGDEMYAKLVPQNLVGRTFGELLLASSNATIIGLEKNDGSVLLGPPLNTVIATGDSVIGIAEDDSVFNMDLVPERWQPNEEKPVSSVEFKRERSLIIGWNQMAPRVIMEIEADVAPGSELVVLVNPELHNTALITAQINGLGLVNQTLQLVEGDTIARVSIVAATASGEFDHYLILCENPPFEIDEADARVLLSLMHLRSVHATTAGNIVTELRDPDAVELASDGDGDDFIVSQQLISLLLAQLSESPQLVEVFSDLFGAHGSGIAKHPFARYAPHNTATFAEVIAEARNCGVIAIGYQCAATVGQPGFLAAGLRLNPPKNERITFNSGDKVIVVAQRA